MTVFGKLIQLNEQILDYNFINYFLEPLKDIYLLKHLSSTVFCLTFLPTPI